MKDIFFSLRFSFWILLPALILIAAFFYYLWFKNHRKNFLLYLFDGLFFVFLLLYLFSPVLRFVSSKEVPPTLYFLQDRSLSCSTRHLQSLNSSIDLKRLQGLVDGAGGRLKLLAFGNGMRMGFDTNRNDQLASRSDFNAVVRKLLLHKRDKPVAFFVASDGNFFAPPYLKGSVPFFPLLPVKEKRVVDNSSIARIDCPSFLEQGKQAAIFASVRSSQRGRSIVFSVDGKIVAKQPVKIGGGRYRFSYRPTRKGEVVLQVGFADGVKDNFAADDRRSKIVKIVSGATPLLLIYDYPDPDITFLYRFLSSLKNYRVTKIGPRQRYLLAKGLNNAKIIIMVNLRTPFSNVGRLLKRVRSGAGLVYLHGESGTVLPGIAKMLPFYSRYRSSIHRINYSFESQQSGSIKHRGLNELLTSFRGKYLLSGISLKKRAFLVAGVGKKPFLSWNRYGMGSVFAITGGPLWRWDFSSLGFGLRTDNYARFWGSMLETVAQEHILFKVRVSQSVVLPGERVAVYLYGRMAKSVAFLRCKEIGDSALYRDFSFFEQKGYKVAHIKVNKFGAYKLFLGYKGKLKDSGTRLLVRAHTAEYKKIFINRTVLKKIAFQTGGKIIYTLDKLPTGINFTKRSSLQQQSLPLVQNPVGLVLLILFFSGGIYYRRKKVGS